MTASIHTESMFEAAIVRSLVGQGGYAETSASDFSRDLALDKQQTLAFLQETQPARWEKLAAVHGADVENRVMQRLFKELDLRGTLDVLRNGIVDYGVRFDMAYFKPESKLNPETRVLYDRNRLTVVQTLSRLNRIHSGKEDTFILDFVNDRTTILDAFQPFYELTTVEQPTDPNHLYDLKNTLDGKQVYWQSEIDAFSRVYFTSRNMLNPREQGKLNAVIDPAVDRYKALQEVDQDEFKRGLRTWTNIYSYLSQIIPFQDAALEKFFAYGRLLLTKLPKTDLTERLKLTDEAALEYYRLQKMSEGAIALEIQGEEGVPNITEAGIQRAKQEKAALSEIIEILNQRFGTEFNNADKLFFDQREEELVNDEKLQM